MNGELAQLIALTAHGNAALAFPGLPDLGSPEEGSVFRYVGELSFLRSPTDQTGGPARVIARTTSEWYDLLRREGVSRLALVPLAATEQSERLPPPIAAGFVGGVNTGIVALRPNAPAEIWSATWGLRGAAPADPQPWGVRYAGRTVGPDLMPPPLIKLTDARAELIDSLQAIRALAAAQELPTWERLFATTLDALLASPLPSRDSTFLPRRGYPPAAHQLLSAAMGGWVFGGMGSWNDYVAPTEETQAAYESVTTQHYNAVMTALAGATNAFDPDWS